MTKLIYKDVLEKDIVKRFGCRPFIEVGNKCEYVHTIINEQPTTTEAEIRANALGVMGMAMKEYYPSCKGAYVDFDVFFHAVMARVAEQLKAE